MLDYDDCEPFEFSREGWQRARKEHTCSACRGQILRGDRYWKHVGKFDGCLERANHCARCHLIWEHLNNTADGGEGPDLFLDCGHGYEETHGGPPPDDIAALAFMTREEAQARIKAPSHD